ncbi:MAG: nucleotidyltransferase domain-containing protein [Clostridiales bacterium]|nr:nucleotidyltransferase domain-containing protein [Clostridiales bacterium]
MSDEIYTISQIKDKLNPVFRRYNIKKAVLFGSYGCGCANVRSDLDLFVDSGLKGLKFIGLIEDVRRAVDKEVDVLDVSHVEENSEIDTEIKKPGWCSMRNAGRRNKRYKEDRADEIICVQYAGV